MLRVVVCVSLVSACSSPAGPTRTAPASPAAEPPAAKAPVDDFASRIAVARKRAADLADEPKPEPAQDAGDTTVWLEKQYAPWVTRKTKIANEAAKLFNRARQIATSHQQRITVLAEKAAMTESMHSEFIDTAIAAFRDSATDPEMVKLVEEVMARQLQPLLESSMDTYELCASHAAKHGIDNTTSRKCGQAAARIAATIDDTPAAPDHKLDEWRDQKLTAKARPLLPTRQPVACQLRGSIRLGGAGILPRATAYATRAGTEHVFSIGTIEASRVVLPTKHGDRIQVDLEWPLVGTLWLEPRAVPFELRRKVDIVKRRTWLAKGARVSAIAVADRKRAEIARPSARWVNGAAAPFEARVRCADLALAGSIKNKTSSGGSTTYVMDRTTLHAKPKGRVLGEIRHIAVRVIGSRGDWVRVRADGSSTTPGSYNYVPFDFDGWIPRPPVIGGVLGGMFGSGVTDAPPTRTTTAPLTVRLEPGSDAPILGQLVVGVDIGLGPTQGAATRIKVPAISVQGREHDLWVTTADLAGATQAPKPAATK